MSHSWGSGAWRLCSEPQMCVGSGVPFPAPCLVKGQVPGRLRTPEQPAGWSVIYWGACQSGSLSSPPTGRCHPPGCSAAVALASVSGIAPWPERSPVSEQGLLGRQGGSGAELWSDGRPLRAEQWSVAHGFGLPFFSPWAYAQPASSKRDLLPLRRAEGASGPGQAWIQFRVLRASWGPCALASRLSGSEETLHLQVRAFL